jgi:Ca2+-binding EF-hand superfamily protein
MLFKLTDTNNDGLISQKEATDAGNLLVGGFFFRADANGDGVLTPEEGRSAREALFCQRPLLRWILERARPASPTAGTRALTSDHPAPRSGDAARTVAADPARAIGDLLDSNHNRNLEASELRQGVQTGVQTLFNFADTNQDGQLSPAELNQAAGEAAKGVVQAAFQTVDADHDGTLTMAEFDEALIEPRHAVFRVLDANSDGRLTLEELKRAARTIADEIRRLRVHEPSNAPWRHLQGERSAADVTDIVTPPVPAARSHPVTAPTTAPRR